MNEQKQKTKDFFNRKAMDYYREHYQVEFEKEKYPSQYIRHQRILGLLEGEKPGWVLDGGCGSGVMACELVRRRWRVVALDIAEKMIKETNERTARMIPRKKDWVKTRVGDVEALDLEDSAMDATLYSGVIEYLEKDEPLLSEARRVLKPGGILIVTSRNRLFNLFSMNDYTRSEIQNGTVASLLEELLGLQSWLEYEKKTIPLLVKYMRERVSKKNIEVFQATMGKVSKPPLDYTMTRRQHSPFQLKASFEKMGFTVEKFEFWHSHPFPVSFEGLSRALFIEMGMALEVLHQTPLAPLICSGLIVKGRKI
ncbi:MAG: class I SAM-dependent methyltransferase [Candidatus Aminicenantes bacterium]|nr:class I SAM-dependent methyltransferase [Candidatus Aminicenantes bacterium]